MKLTILLIVLVALVLSSVRSAQASTSIVLDSVSSAQVVDSGNPPPPFLPATISWSHTVGSGSNAILLVGVSLEVGVSPGDTVAGVTYGGKSLSNVGTHSNAGGGLRAELWELLAPPVGTATVTVTLTNPDDGSAVVAGSMSFFNVLSVTSFSENDGSSTSSPATASLVVNANSGDWVVDVLGTFTTSLATPDPSQTQLYGAQTGSPHNWWGSASDKSASSPVTMSWSVPGFTSNVWLLIGAALTPAATPPIPEYPLGLLILAILAVIAYGVIRRRISYKRT